MNLLALSHQILDDKVSLDERQADAGVDERSSSDDHGPVSLQKLADCDISDRQRVGQDCVGHQKSRSELEVDPCWILSHSTLEHLERLVPMPASTDEVVEAIATQQEGGQVSDVPKEKIAENA